MIRLPKFIIIFVVAVCCIVLVIASIISSNLKDQADTLFKDGRIGESIIIYDKAHSVFPFRQDINDSLAGAKLVLQSDLDYGKISDVDFAEVQVAPPINELPAINTPKAGEIFVPILMYHHIEVNPKPSDPVWASLFVTANQLDSQLQYFKSNGYNAISLDDLYQALTNNKKLPAKSIVLTFDDGYRSFYDNAYPLLKKYNLKATEFIITQVETAPAYLTWDEIIEMDKSGLIEFGAHTRHHPNLPDLSQAGIINEVEGSKKDLEDHLNKQIKWFAYPYGGYNNAVISEVQKSGFEGAVSTIYGAGQSKDKLFLEPRIMVDGRYSLADLVAHIGE